MKNLTYTLKESQEFIPLINLLQIMNIAQSGGHAKIMVSEGKVSVNGSIELRKRNKLRKGDLVELDDFEIRLI